MPKNATPINLTDEETCYLESLVNKGTIEARVYRRAKILLLKSAGMSNEAIAEKLDYKNHSGVLKRIRKIGQAYEAFTGEDYGFTEKKII